MAETSAKLEIIASVRDQISRSFKEMERNSTRSIGGIRKWMKDWAKDLFSVRGLLAGIATYLSARALVNNTREVARAAAETERWATRLNMTVGEMDALDYVAEQTGTSLGAMRDGLTNLQEKLGKAADGSKQMQAAFATLGIDVLDPLTGQLRDAVHLLPELAEAFQRLRAEGRGGQLAGLTEDLLGGQGSELAALLLRGPREIARALGRVQELGVMTARQAATARVVTQAFADVDRVVRNLQLSLLEAFGPDIVAALRTFGDLIRINREEIVGLVKDVAALAVQGLQVAARVTIVVIRGVLDAIDWVRGAVQDTIGVFARTWTTMKTLFFGIGADAKDATDLGSTSAARAGLDQFEGQLGTLSTTFDRFSEKWQARWGANRESAVSEIDRIVEAGTNAATDLEAGWSPFFAGFKDGFKAWRAGLSDFEALGKSSATEAFQSVEDGVTGFVASVIKATESIQDAWKSMLRSILEDWINTFARIASRSILEALFGAIIPGGGGLHVPGGPGTVIGGRTIPGGGSDLRGLGNGSGGGALVLNLQQTINAVDGQSAAAFFAANRGAMVAVFADAMQRNQQLKSLVRKQ